MRTFGRCALAVLAALFLILPDASFAAEGDALLSMDEMRQLKEAYDPFLRALEEVLINRGLLKESDRETWYEAQIGDYFANGGYGSILITYQPDALNYIREEEMATTISCSLPEGQLMLSTMRRYSPGDSTSSGLMLSFSVLDRTGLPEACSVQLDSDEGYFSRWDVMTASYQNVGTQAVTQGETLVWTAPVPAAKAQDPLLTISVYDDETGEQVGRASLRLRVDGESYVIDADALTPIND